MASLNRKSSDEFKNSETEISSVFNWSPLPQKRHFTKQIHARRNMYTGEDLYPNCDASVWLRSCEEEITEPIQGIVKGHIPEWLNGTLVRNGPGSLKVGEHNFEHLFDSAALLHRFHIQRGTVSYLCRFLKSDEYKRNMLAKRIVITTFGTSAVADPCHTIFQRVSSAFNFKENQSDNAMISVYPFGDELYAFTECPVIHQVNSKTLQTEKKVDVSDYVAIVHHTSHPHVMADGTVYNLAMSVGITGPCHSIVRFPSNFKENGKGSMFESAHFVANIPVRWPLNPPYMHTFGITDNYFVIVEQPLTLSVIDLVKCRVQNEPLLGAMKWFFEEKTKFTVISRESGKLMYSFYAEPFFYLHIINQYEIDNYVVIDICCYRDPSMIECMYVEAMQNIQTNPNYAKMFRGRPLRFVLPICFDKSSLKCNENLIKLDCTKAMAYLQPDGNIFVNPEKICELGCETPRIHYEKYLGKKYQYFYAISADVDADNPGTIIKVDVKNKTTLTWCEDNCYPSEPIFVPSPNSQDEDDGVVLAAMVWGREDVNHVGMIILDAKTYKEIGRAEFKTPGPVPKCLHGWFLPERSD